MSSVSQYKQWMRLRRRTLRIAMGMHKATPNEIIDHLIGTFNENETYRRMQSIQEHRYANFMTYINNKGLIDYFNLYHKEYWKDIDKDQRMQNIFNIIEKQKIMKKLEEKGKLKLLGQLTWEVNGGPGEGRRSCRIQQGIVQGKNHNKIKQYEQKLSNIYKEQYGERYRKQWNGNAVRRIPGYNFFKMFKYTHLLCKEHNRHLTIAHIAEEHCQDIEKPLRVIWEFMWDENKETLQFYKKKTLHMKLKMTYIIKRIEEKIKNVLTDQ